MKGQMTGPDSWALKLDEGSRIHVRVSRIVPGTVELGLPWTVVRLTRDEILDLVDGLMDIGDMLEVRG